MIARCLGSIVQCRSPTWLRRFRTAPVCSCTAQPRRRSRCSTRSLRGRDLDGVRLYHLHTLGTASFVDSDVATGCGPFVLCWTGCPRGRSPRVAPTSCRSSCPTSRAVHGGAVPLDVAIVQLSPPDRHGFVTLGTSVDAARRRRSARIVLAEINAHDAAHARTHSALRIDRIHAFTRTDRPLHRRPARTETPSRRAIGELIAELVEDGACCKPASAPSRMPCLRGSAISVDLGFTPRCSPTA